MVNLTEFQREQLAAIYFGRDIADPHAAASEFLGVDRQEAKRIVYQFFYTQPYWRSILNAGQKDYKAGWKKGLERGKRIANSY